MKAIQILITHIVITMQLLEAKPSSSARAAGAES